jgi:crotonobetainyl-CoA:carnitine CoA-transferase CaiB-like acyl-CoA transferase
MPHQADLRRALEPYFRELSTDEVIERVVRGDGIAVPVNDHADLVEHAQVQTMGIVVDGEHARTLAPPWRRHGDAFPPVTAAAPGVGDDTDQVLRDAGLDDAEIRDVAAAAEMRPEVTQR